VEGARCWAWHVIGKVLTTGRCENGLSVETTAWEGWKARQEGAKRSDGGAGI
jgi:uncharacterized membrane protein YecN with MAPEG domain